MLGACLAASNPNPNPSPSPSPNPNPDPDPSPNPNPNPDPNPNPPDPNPNQAAFCVTAELLDGGRRLEGLAYEDVCKLAVEGK